MSDHPPDRLDVEVCLDAVTRSRNPSLVVDCVRVAGPAFGVSRVLYRWYPLRRDLERALGLRVAPGRDPGPVIDRLRALLAEAQAETRPDGPSENHVFRGSCSCERCGCSIPQAPSAPCR